MAGRGASLTVTPKLRGHAVQCSVTASNSAGGHDRQELPVQGLLTAGRGR
jgi:hypothetical protein